MTGRWFTRCLSLTVLAFAAAALLPPPVPGMDCAPRRVDSGPCVRALWASGFSATVCPAGYLPLGAYPPGESSFYLQDSLTIGAAVWWN